MQENAWKNRTKEGHTALGTVSPWNSHQGVLPAPMLYQLQTAITQEFNEYENKHLLPADKSQLFCKT
jgi:hypothetical protein